MNTILIFSFILLFLYFKFKKKEVVNLIPKKNKKRIVKIFTKKSDKINYLKYCLKIQLHKFFLKKKFNFEIEKEIKYQYCLFYLNYLVENFINNELVLYEIELNYFEKNLLNFCFKFIYYFDKNLFKFENKIIVQSYLNLSKKKNKIKNKKQKILKIEKKLLKQIFKLISEFVYLDLIKFGTFLNQNKLKKKLKLLIKNY